jgi:DNA-binding transcriptional ArsR family regulator
MTLLSESQLDVVMSVTAFIAVFIAVTAFVRLKIKLDKKKEKVDIKENQHYIIESVLSKHLEKLDKIVSSIGELKARMDLLESHDSFSTSDVSSSAPKRTISSTMNTRTKQYENSPEFKTDMVRRDRVSDIISQDLADDKSYKYTVRDSVSSNSYPDIKRSIHQETSTYILRLLRETPRSAREIQYNVGKTREHTSRLMKKLHDEGLVDRNMSTKPFIYKITDEGRKLLE